MADDTPRRAASAFEFEEPAQDAPSRMRSASGALFLGIPKRGTAVDTFTMTPRQSEGSFVERRLSNFRLGGEASTPTSFERAFDQFEEHEARISLGRQNRQRSSSNSSPRRLRVASDAGGASSSRRRRTPSDVGGFAGGFPEGLLDAPEESLSPGGGAVEGGSPKRSTSCFSFENHTDETMLQLPTRRVSAPRLRLATFDEGIEGTVIHELSGEVERRSSGLEPAPRERAESHYTGLASSFSETERLSSSFADGPLASDEVTRIASRGALVKDASERGISESIKKERKRAEGHHWAPNALEFDRNVGWIHRQHDSDESDDKASRWRLWLLVITAAFISAFVSFVLAFGSVGLQHFVQSSHYSSWTAWEVFFYRQLLMMLLPVAAYVFSVVLTFKHPISIMQFVGGSGIPELKCEMTGVHLVGVFHWRVVVAKMTGLICCAGASLPVGMEGPFVHLAASIGHALTMKVHVFKPLRYSNMLRNMALTAMIAVGLACSFAAPVGGTLYAVELLDGFGSVGYLHCFLGATAAWTCVTLATWFTQVVLEGTRTGENPDEVGTIVPQELFTINGTFAESNDAQDPYYWGVFGAYLVLGILCGLLGSVFVRLHRRMVLGVKRIVTVGGDASSPPPVVETPLPGTIDEIGGRFCTCGAVLLEGTASCQTCGRRWSTAFVDGSVEMDSADSFTHAASMDTQPRAPAAPPEEQEELTAEEVHRAAAAAATAAAAAKPAKPRQKKTYVALLVAAVATFNALLTYFVPMLRNKTQGEVLNSLISTQELPWGFDREVPLERFLSDLPECWLLLGCVCLKLVTTVMVLGLPLPVGSIAPTFVLGAFVGRLFGEMLEPLCGILLGCEEGILNLEARFALVGSCAFCAGTFRSLAQVVMVFELTGLTEMLIPLCASSLAAIFTANGLGINFFESAIQLKNLPHLPALATGRGKLKVGDIMDTAVPVLPPQVAAEELERIRSKFPDWQYEVPIVMRANWDVYHDSSHSLEVGDTQLVIVAAVPHMPPPQPPGTILDLWQEVQSVPLQVPAHTVLKDLLPMLKHMEKSVSFVTRSGYLKGAVTLSSLYKKAVSRPLPPKISQRFQDQISRTARRSAFAMNGRRRSGPL